MSLPDDILLQLTQSDGQNAVTIARALKVDRTAVNSTLYGILKGKVRRDSSYKWWLVKSDSASLSKARLRTGAAEAPVLDHALAKLCRYYLSCIARDDRQKAETWARSLFGDADYGELRAIPDAESLSDLAGESDTIRRLVGKVRASKGKKELLLGYPTYLHRFKTKKGDWSWTVRPVLLLPVQIDDVGGISIESPVPETNPLVVKEFLEADGDAIVVEQARLRDELGLTEELDEHPSLDEIAACLRDIRPEWGWREELDPTTLHEGLALSELDEPGIYNRAILLVGDRSPYTRGLDAELQMLMRTPEAKWADTALGQWVRRRLTNPVAPNQDPLLEVLALNSEQRAAVEHSRSAALTVVTGPPGTGKSQVVSNILINAAWQGQRTLFTSKNNKAVDVVEARVNGLADRPLLMRLGASQYAGKLATHIKGLLSGVVTADDREQMARAKREHQSIREEWNRLERLTEDLRRARNRMPSVEANVAAFREQLGDARFLAWESRALELPLSRWKDWIELGARLKPSGRAWWERLLWKWIGPQKVDQVASQIRADGELWNLLGEVIPVEGAPESDWFSFLDRLAAVMPHQAPLREYHEVRTALDTSMSLEDLTVARNGVVQKMTSVSREIWDLWMRLAPDRLDGEARTVMGQFGALLELVAANSGEGGVIDSKTWARFYSLSEKVTTFLPCWAVTSLSVKGRVPLEPGYFDLVVIDEASQCDIASMIPLLYRAKRAVVIGDPYQLRHITRISDKEEILLMRQAGMEGYEEWSYVKHSLYDLAAIRAGRDDVIGLVDHHRSHAHIIEFSNRHIYGGSLRVATKYDKLILPPRGEPAVRWVDVRGNTERPESGSCRNPPEASTVLQELRRIVLEQKYEGSIGVVTPFRAQENLIRELVQRDRDLTAALSTAAQPFIVDTADGFQGDQRSLILFSPVIASNMAPGTVGFLEKDKNRFNVAITRAESALIVVGDKSVALAGRWKILSDFASYQEGLARSSRSQTLRMAIPSESSEYPHVANPESVSEWEKILYRALVDAGIPTIPQYEEEAYRLDLALVHGDHKLDIEVDGERYHKDWTGELCRRDLIRNHRLIELGWDVQRFWVHQVRDDLQGCVQKVLSWYNSHPCPALEMEDEFLDENGDPSDWDSDDDGDDLTCHVCATGRFTVVELVECSRCGAMACPNCVSVVETVKYSEPDRRYLHKERAFCTDCRKEDPLVACDCCGRIPLDGIVENERGTLGLCEECFGRDSEERER